MDTRTEQVWESSAVAPLKGHRSDIQVLRGIAVLAVVAFHAGDLLPGGYVGVDIFFVISGFVIGRLLLSEFMTSGGLSFSSFYVRRARRLLPALGLMLAAVVLLAPLLAPMGASPSTSGTGIAAALFSANFYLYSHASLGYFDAASTMNPLLHTWSLSVEEQFYFVMPVSLLVAWRVGVRFRRPLLALRLFIGLVVLASLAACLAFSYTSKLGPLDGLRFAFFSPVTRAWEFALGLALVVLPVGAYSLMAARRAAVLVGGALCGAAVLLLDQATRFPGTAALLPTVGAALIIFGGTSPAISDPATEAHPVARPLIWLGGVSYAWYLWHWPLIVFAGAFWPEAGRMPLVIAAAVSILPAWLSYRLLEPRFRARPTSRLAPTIALAVCCIAAPIAAAAVARPITQELNRRVYAAGYSPSLTSHADEVHGCDSIRRFAERRQDTCAWGPPDSTKSVVLVGDSNAGHFSEAMIGAAQADSARLRIATSHGCPFVDSLAGPRGRACLDYVSKSLDDLVVHPPQVVVISNDTAFYVENSDRPVIDPSSGARATTPEGKAAAFQSGLEQVVSRLTAAGIKVVIINNVPIPKVWDPMECSTLLVLTAPERCSFPPFTLQSNSVGITANEVERQAASASGATVWNFNMDICPDGLCASQRNHTFVFSNAGHITVATSKTLADRAAQDLDEVLN